MLPTSIATAAIETASLTKRYGDARGIEGVDLTVERGEVFGFLGPNGAGKTTTIRTLLGLLRPTGGSARILGLDVEREAMAAHARVGNLPGDFTCDPRLSGRDLLELCAAIRGTPDLGVAGRLSERFGADLDRPLGELSRGNRQKVGLIQALFHEPELLVLDEPTSGLDPLMQEEFLAVVADHRDRGGTVFLSSHDLDEVQWVCDRVAIIRDGRIVAVEAVAALRGRSYRHVAIEFAGAVDPAELTAIPGVSGLLVHGHRITFQARGELDAVRSITATQDARRRR